MATIKLKDVDLYYQADGTGSSLLLIHGTQPDGNTWGSCFEALASHHFVITYDRRGFSRSIHPPITDYLQHAEDAAALLRQLQAEPVTIVGWSWGGIIALELAAREPALVRGLILIEPALHLKKHLTFSLFKTVGKVQLLRRFRGDIPAAEAFLRWACQYRTGGSAFSHFPQEVQETIRRNATLIVKEIDAGTGEELTPERIATICCPVTCIQGELSAPEFGQAIERITKLIPHTKVRSIPGASHAIHFDRPNEFCEAILEVAQEYV